MGRVLRFNDGFPRLIWDLGGLLRLRYGVMIPE